MLTMVSAVPDSGTPSINGIVVVEALAKTDAAIKTPVPSTAAQTEDEFYDEDSEEDDLLITKAGGWLTQ